jgi:hypothetical protein
VPLEHLEKLFSEIGEAAEKLAAIRAQTTGPTVVGGRVARSEDVRSVADIYAQTKGIAGVPLSQAIPEADPLMSKKTNALAQSIAKAIRESLARTQGTKPDTLAESIAKAIRQSLAETHAPAKATAPPEKQKSGLLESVKRLPPLSWVEAGLKLAEYAEKQEEAGKAVDGFTRAVGAAARFLYSMATGNVILHSGRRVPWRRALAVAMRGNRANRRLRRALVYPDIVLRRLRRTLASAHRLSPPGPKAATKAAATTAARSARAESQLARAARTPPQSGAARGASALGTTAAQALARGAGAGAQAGAAEGAVTIAFGTVGRAALALASPVGAAVGAVIALTAAVVAAVTALRKFTVSVYESSKAILTNRFERFAQFNPAIGAAQARVEASEIRSRINTAQATSGTTVLLTEALLQLGKEMGPINRALINVQNLAAILLIQVARGVNALVKLTVIVPLIDWISRKLGKNDQKDMPVEEFLRALEGLAGNQPRNPPPKGGLPPWQ